MPSKMRRYGTAGRPGVPGGFSGPRNGAIRLHNSSGVCHSVSNEVSVAVILSSCHGMSKESLGYLDLVFRFSDRLFDSLAFKYGIANLQWRGRRRKTFARTSPKPRSLRLELSHFSRNASISFQTESSECENLSDMAFTLFKNAS